MLPSLISAILATLPIALAAPGNPLPGTDPLLLPDDVVAIHLHQVQGYFLRQIAAAEHARDRQWQPYFTSPAAYQASLALHVPAIRAMLGLPLQPGSAGPVKGQTVAAGKQYRIERLTIGLAEGRQARGLLILPQPPGPRRPLAIVCPDADTWPERFLGLDTGRPPAWIADLLARGSAIYVPQSIERLRDHPYSITTQGKDRRWILYRLGYVVGRTMPGVDVEDVLAAAAALAGRLDLDAGRIAVVGLGQGGMTALVAAALDRRFVAVVVADYFQCRDRCWQEPVDRRLPGQLLTCGDAELVALIAPRRLDVLCSAGTEIPRASAGREFDRAKRFYRGLGSADRLRFIAGVPAEKLPAKAAAAAAEALGLPTGPPFSPGGRGAGGEGELPGWRIADKDARQTRDTHFEEALKSLRARIDASESRRQSRWNLVARPAAEFPRIQAAMLADYRQLVGEVHTSGVPLRPRTELVLETPKFRAYKVLLNVAEGVETYGQLLLPTGVSGRRPAVVCQHGLSGRPEMITGVGHEGDTPYHAFGARLAERGFVVFAPLVAHYHPVEWTNDQARQADAVGMMRVSMVIAQTQRVVDFLQSLDFVDPKRIGYYGLSYGGYSALWVPPLVDRLSAVVVSGHFNDWRSKITCDTKRTSYLLHPDEDFYNWDVLDRFTHVELVAMMPPRAVCIEYGRRDGITTPEWTAYAWRQLQAVRDHLGLGNRVRLVEFDGPHEVHGVESFSFLDEMFRP